MMSPLEYCDWAADAIMKYQIKLAIMSNENPDINLSLPRGQIPWAMNEAMIWANLRRQHQ